MSRYLMKYKGQYRIKPNLDLELNDFPRDENGGIDSSYDDIYIKCANGSQIYHHGRSTLVAYVPSLGRGHNILIAIAKDLKLIDEEDKSRDYKSLYQILNEDKTVFDIVETDEEVEFKFNAKNIELIAKYLKPLTSGADISPFSSKNLPKTRYDIPDEKLKKYKEIIHKLDKKEILKISKFTNQYIEKIDKKGNISDEIKKLNMKSIEYLYMIGKFDDYLKFLEKEVDKYVLQNKV